MGKKVEFGFSFYLNTRTRRPGTGKRKLLFINLTFNN